MNAYKSSFTGKHTLLVVVHAENKMQVLRNARIAHEEGAHGIFLINHSIAYQDLFSCYQEVRAQLPDFWIGLNCLDLGAGQAFQVIPKNVSGLWADKAGITEKPNPTEKAECYKCLRAASGWDGIYFGSVAFKYQTPVKDPALVAARAVPFVDVITTSGDATGSAAPLEKIRTMRTAIGEHPLAIASGITASNVSEYMPYADCFLVATGVSNSYTELNALKVRKLAAIVRG